MRLAIITPVFGQRQFTERLLDDLFLDAGVNCGFDTVYVVDNGGDHEQRYTETVLRQKENLGWCRGTNKGLATAKSRENYDAFICMNNDVRLCPNFLNGIRKALNAKPLAGLLAPLYDDVWGHQRYALGGPAENFSPLSEETSVKFVDGTCIVIPRRTLDTIGLFDEEHFGQYGWGADFDYAIKVREAGAGVYVTHRAYLNHLHQGTAKTISPNWNGLAGNEMEAGMQAKYGENWRSLIH
jgi:GT2 family glycosyltransferase